MKIVLISCVNQKEARRCKARDLYTSWRFKCAFHYAQSLCPDKIFILSARYGLVNQEREIEPYDETLKDKSASEIRAWADEVVNALKQQADLEKDTFIILAGERYRKHIVRRLTNCNVPMQGLKIGQQGHWLKEHCS